MAQPMSLQTSSNSTPISGSDATGGSDGVFGDFNFKTQSASGAASVAGVSPWLVVGGVAVLGAVAWFVLRKQSRA